MLSNTLELTLRKALYLPSTYKHEYATCEHLLLALMEDKDQAHLKRSDILNYSEGNNNFDSVVQDVPKKQISYKNIKSDGLSDRKLNSQINSEPSLSEPSAAIGKPETELEKYCINLNNKANEDDIDCLIGRHEEIQRTVEILCRHKKNNALLVGESGVGKTAIAEGLAVRIVKGDV
ncbi:unnamed protein product [Rotaria magnacalcarata]|uniref:Clp R domain-containing protein n=1 Tax=Rotaria magnacalcarata TaxID=392030 RepID=A0A820C2Q2_9BILA|nr:unnamed protein product [Rotaria magnacalcarata]CAF4215640.1 unnamed protein product [Rotaria magnacalcarata]